MSPESKDYLAEALQEVENLSPEEIEAEAKKILARRAQQQSYRKTKVSDLTPDQLAKRKTYRQTRYARDKAILEAAKNLRPELFSKK